MKKIIIVLIISLLCITGCGKISGKDVIHDFHQKYDKSSGYQLRGKFEVTNHDEVYQYELSVDMKKDGYYKVTFFNTSNQFQQIILKNDEGVFLLTPSLNKSFKFQSEWPYNHSQVYLLDALLRDIDKDSNYTFKNQKTSYMIQTKVDYPNNHKLSYQKILFDKNYHLKKVVVFDENDSVCMTLMIDSLDYSPKFSNNYFDLDSIIDSDQEMEEQPTSVIEDVIYPLVLPDGTKLVNEEKVSKTNGERVIMTFDGEKSFLLVEETIDVFHDFMVIPTIGEPIPLMDTIGIMTDNSLSWSSGNMEYYLVSDVMNQEELVDIAQSILGISSFK